MFETDVAYSGRNITKFFQSYVKIKKNLDFGLILTLFALAGSMRDGLSPRRGKRYDHRLGTRMAFYYYFVLNAPVCALFSCLLGTLRVPACSSVRKLICLCYAVCQDRRFYYDFMTP